MVLNHPCVVTIRDTETVQSFQERLRTARRMLVVGNGGIATELVHFVRNVECIWSVKHASISHTFLDAGAAEFLLPQLNNTSTVTSAASEDDIVIRKRLTYAHDQSTGSPARQAGMLGSALGPDWAEAIAIEGAAQQRRIHVVYNTELSALYSPDDLRNKHMNETPVLSFEKSNHDVTDWPVYCQLTNGDVFGCDVVVSAVGHEPDTAQWCSALVDDQFTLSSDDGGLLVDERLCTNVERVHAAGDVCTAGWQWAPHWFQMRLWTQARQMGAQAARIMHALCAGMPPPSLDICFEVFAHCTRFFDYKVVLLGKYNAQGLEQQHTDTLVRMKKRTATDPGEYVKVVLYHGRVFGALLVGETDLEETMENLILNGTDVSNLADDLLNPTVDIEDYFD